MDPTSWQKVQDSVQDLCDFMYLMYFCYIKHLIDNSVQFHILN